MNASVEVSDYMGWLFLTYSRDSINKLSKTNRYKNVCPLHVACTMGNLEVADYLIENGSDINTEIIPNFISSTGIGKGYTPLYLALSNDKQNIVTLLLNKGADFETNGRLPSYWHVASKKSKIQLINRAIYLYRKGGKRGMQTIIYALIDSSLDEGIKKSIRHELKQSQIEK